MRINKKHLIYIGLACLGYFIYFLWIVNPSLFLIKNYREFFTDIYFFSRYFDFPGNPAEYISRFLTQLFVRPVLASMVVTCILLSIYWLGFFAFRKAKNNLLLPYLPVLVLMVMHNNYSHSMRFDVDILSLFLAALIYFRSFRNIDWMGHVLYPILLVAVFFINGFLTALFFSLMAVTSVFVLKKKIIHLPVILVESLFVWLIFQSVFSYSMHDFHHEILDILRFYSAWYLLVILYGSVFILFIFYNLLNFRILNEPGNTHFSNQKNILFTIGIVGFSGALIFLTFNHEQKMELSVQYEALNRNWNRVLEYSRRCDFPDKNVAYYTNEALYHTGHMADELFHYKQAFGSEGLMASEIDNYSEIAPNQQVCMDLGALSLSVVWGTEATNVYGANQYILKNLTKAYLAEGCIKEAQKMLNLLDHTLFNTNWVQRYQRLVNDTTLIKNDPELYGYIKAQLPAAIVSKTSVGLNLYLLSRTSNTNKMAYDYLLISTLLDIKMQDFGTCLTGLKTFGYTTIPKLYFEGLIYYMLFSNYSPINMKEFSFDRNIIIQFGAFRRDYSALKSRPEEARKQLNAKYGNTYWYYVLFQSPISDADRKKIGDRLAF